LERTQPNPGLSGELALGQSAPPVALEDLLALFLGRVLTYSACELHTHHPGRTTRAELDGLAKTDAIFQHYRELVTEKAAKAWFAITPEAAKALKAKLDKEQEAKIVKFPATAAA
jgi:hypothetical protein